MAEKTYTIRLMNGSELDGILESEQPKTIISDQLRLDTTGQYLTVGAPTDVIRFAGGKPLLPT